VEYKGLQRLFEIFGRGDSLCPLSRRRDESTIVEAFCLPTVIAWTLRLGIFALEAELETIRIPHYLDLPGPTGVTLHLAFSSGPVAVYTNFGS